MCTICRKFKKGALTIQEARAELEEQSEYLNEDHIEDIEEMLFEAEDAYDYINERKNAYLEEDDLDAEDYLLDEDKDFPAGSDKYWNEEDD
jgi:hypothetical protein